MSKLKKVGWLMKAQRNFQLRIMQGVYWIELFTKITDDL